MKKNDDPDFNAFLDHFKLHEYVRLVNTQVADIDWLFQRFQSDRRRFKRVSIDNENAQDLTEPEKTFAK